MANIRVIHVENKKELEIIDDGVIFYVDGRPGRFSDPRQSALVGLIASRLPRYATFDECRDLLIKNGRHGIHDKDELDLAYLRKKVMQINDILRSATGCSRFLRSVKGKGYVLSHEWSLSAIPTIERTLNEDISTLEQIIVLSIEMVDTAEFFTDDSGAKTVVVDARVISHNKMLVGFIGRRVVDTLLGRCSKGQLAELRSLFDVLTSYVTFSRSGRDISNENWQKAFRYEIVEIYRQVEAIVSGCEAGG